MSPAATLPTSLDLSHHLTKRCRAATPSAMKALGKLLMDNRMMSLGGGLPHRSLFPMQQMNFTIPSAAYLSDADVTGWTQGDADVTTLSFRKDGPGIFSGLPEGILDLDRVLQYGLSAGFQELVKPLEELNHLVHGKAIADGGVYVSLGCTDGVSKTFMMFCEPGDNVLCEQYTFASSLNSGRSKGVNFVPVKMDGGGLMPEDLEEVMSTWDESTQGPKPHLIYLIPTGQNPTGLVMSDERYTKIYALAQKYDLIIMEDDPYFPLQFKPYTSDVAKREAQVAAARASLPPLPTDGSEDDVRAVAKVYNDYAGVRSFLSRDVDGRVVRLDTFSKVYGPGLRLGTISCNSMFVDRFLRLGESTTQVPCNISQAIMASVLDSKKGWGLGGWLRWCFAVRLEYQMKRDFFLDTLAKHVPSEYVTTIPAGGGMFQWLDIQFHKHPRFVRHKASEATHPTAALTNTAALLQEFFDALVADRVLAMPGYLFAVPGRDFRTQDDCSFMRATFAGNLEEIEAALTQFGKTTVKFFEGPQASGGETDILSEA